MGLKLQPNNNGSSPRTASVGGEAEGFLHVRFCNRCGHSMEDPRSFIVAYWRAEQTVYFCWCNACGYRWELAEITKITTTELEGGGEEV